MSWYIYLVPPEIGFEYGCVNDSNTWDFTKKMNNFGPQFPATGLFFCVVRLHDEYCSF